MALSEQQAIEQARILFEYHEAEREELNLVRRYWKGRQRLPAVIPIDSPREVRVMARSARVNIMPIVVNSLVQSSFVDGFRAAKDDKEDLDVWRAWQANKMDARQSAIYRATSAYGAGYATVLPGEIRGESMPVIRPVSPRSMTTLYGEDPDWPMWGFERLGHGLFRIWDDQATYFVQKDDRATGGWTFIESRIHGLGFNPIIRFLDELDLDDEDECEAAPGLVSVDYPDTTRGQIVPLMPIQDQIDLTTLGLQIAQHYGAFKQRYIIGWTAEDEREALKASAMKFLTLDGDPNEIKAGQWDETNLDGFIKSREATLRHGATLSQTPVHELIGELVNLSAEALAAAEAGKDRKVNERHTNWGESQEQLFWATGQIMKLDVPEDSQVVWRDTSARAFAATIDGLGKIAQMLGVPAQELWERIPGVTKQDVERFKAAAANGDAFSQLTQMLDRQAAGVNGNG